MKTSPIGQTGYSAITMVMILMLLALLLLNNTHKNLFVFQTQTVSESYFYQDYNLAASSLAWGLQQYWSVPSNQWQCLTHNNEELTACIKSSLLNQWTMIKGQAGQIKLYSLVKYDAQSKILHYKKGNWLDFCPEKDDDNCED